MGDHVVLKDMISTSMDGQIGILESWDAESGRWFVHLSDQKFGKIIPEKLQRIKLVFEVEVEEDGMQQTPANEHPQQTPAAEHPQQTPAAEHPQACKRPAACKKPAAEQVKVAKVGAQKKEAEKPIWDPVIGEKTLSAPWLQCVRERCQMCEQKLWVSTHTR
jgi:hypothetical protein